MYDRKNTVTRGGGCRVTQNGGSICDLRNKLTPRIHAD